MKNVGIALLLMCVVLFFSFEEKKPCVALRVDPEMSQNVLIENITFDKGDDAIAICVAEERYHRGGAGKQTYS